MTHLVPPQVRHQDSYLTATDELLASGEQRDGDGDWVQEPEDGYAGFAFTRDGLRDPAEFARFVVQRRRARHEDAPRRRGWTPVTFLWMVAGDEYVGRWRSGTVSPSGCSRRAATSGTACDPPPVGTATRHAPSRRPSCSPTASSTGRRSC